MYKCKMHPLTINHFWQKEMSKVKSTTIFTNCFQKHVRSLGMKIRKTTCRKEYRFWVASFESSDTYFSEPVSTLHSKPSIQTSITYFKHLYSSRKHVSSSKTGWEVKEDKIQIHLVCNPVQRSWNKYKKTFRDSEFHFSMPLLASAEDNQTVYWRDL